MKAYDVTKKVEYGPAKRSLDPIDARLARREPVTRLTLILVVIVAGLWLALLAAYLFNHSS